MNTTMKTTDLASLGFGALAFLGLMGAYFGILTLVSGWKFTLDQFSDFWYFIVPLGAGFGIQVGLFTSLKQGLRGHHAGGGVVAATGTTSTAAMISCCAHYLTNIAPLLGATGAVVLITQYQTELFWVGLAFPAMASAQTLPPRSTDAAGVTVTVKPLGLTPGAKTWDFEITMETHTKPLEQALARVSLLVDDGAKQYKPSAWKGA